MDCSTLGLPVPHCFLEFAQVHLHWLGDGISMFILAISCLTTSNLSWFINLTFKVPMQYCSLQHRIWLSPPDTFTTEDHLYFHPAASFFMEQLVIVLQSSPVACWTPSNLGGGHGSSFGVIPLCLFILFMEFSWQEYWSGLPFPSTVDQVLLDLSLWPVCLAWHGSLLHWVMQGSFPPTTHWQIRTLHPYHERFTSTIASSYCEALRLVALFSISLVRSGNCGAAICPIYVSTF